MNKLTITGNLTSDPVQRDYDGKKLTEFRVAVDRKFKVNGQKVTDFFRVKCWRQNAEYTYNYGSKGRKVLVIGELQAGTYTDQEGMTRMSLDIVADEVEFLGGKSSDDQTQEQKPAKPKNYTEKDFTDIQSDDIPF